MKRLAPDIERLMWLVAEGHDPKAIADFEARFPELRLELSKRISLVSNLKSAGKQVRPTQAPRFVPRPPADRPAPTRGLIVALAALVAAIAFATYAVTAKLGRHDQPPVAQHVDGGSAGPPIAHPQNPDGMRPITVNPPTGDPIPTPPPQPVRRDDPLQRIVTVKMDNAPIEGAVLMVCQQAHLQYEIAPGMPQDFISIDYEGVPAAQVLEDLGAKYGFTALPQEEGKVLIVPARPLEARQ